MTWLVEDPLPIALAGLVLAAVFFFVLAQYGRGITALAVFGTLLLTGGMLVMESWIVTPFEQVEYELDGLATALERNDIPAVMNHLGTDPDNLRRTAADYLGRYTVRKARIGSNLTVAFNNLVSPREATAKFTGRLDLEPTGASVGRDHFVGDFTIRFVWHEDRWLVSGYDARN